MKSDRFAMRRSVALTTDAHERLAHHLARADGQEDLTFALYRPSQGATRKTAIVSETVLPQPEERRLHGNASFTGDYLLRALETAADADAGLALLHSHPAATSWQGMSRDDIAAERDTVAAQARRMTGLPLVGMTLGTGDMRWSARFWEHGDQRVDCENVRVVGHQMQVSFNGALRPPPPSRTAQTRTVSAWGRDVQADLARLRVAIVGAGSVGSMVAESLVRTGIERVTLIDFDAVKRHNLDRLLHATERDVRLARSKVECLRRGLLKTSTAVHPHVDARELSVVENAGLAEALDCDVIFSCVDRPWARSALNLVAYAHLIPVIDGGIRVQVANGRLQGADWKAHVAVPGRRCLECLGQYDPALVSMEREGLLDDPAYIAGLPDTHPLRANENVFAFSAGAASLEVLQMLSMVVAPSGLADVGAQNYHFVTGELDTDPSYCEPRCLYSGQFLAAGDTTGLVVTGRHHVAEAERQARRHEASRVRIRLRRWFGDRFLPG